jgi:hypothetical protein
VLDELAAHKCWCLRGSAQQRGDGRGCGCPADFEEHAAGPGLIQQCPAWSGLVGDDGAVADERTAAVLAVNPALALQHLKCANHGRPRYGELAHDLSLRWQQGTHRVGAIPDAPLDRSHDLRILGRGKLQVRHDNRLTTRLVEKTSASVTECHEVRENRVTAACASEALSLVVWVQAFEHVIHNASGCARQRFHRGCPGDTPTI